MKTSMEIISLIEKTIMDMEKNMYGYSWGEYHVISRLYSEITGTEFIPFEKIFNKEKENVE